MLNKPQILEDMEMMNKFFSLILVVALTGCDVDSRPTIPCAVDADCPAGSYCDTFHGFCEFPVYDPYTGTGLVCAYDNECPAGYLCDRSIDACVEGCRSDANCAWNEYCDSYTKLCYEIPGCTDDLDCPAGNYCDIDGSCVLYEEHEVVVEEAGCLSDADCPAGTYCESDGYCWEYDYARCEGDWDCYNGEYCAQDGYCAKVEPLCASSVDCPMDTICRGGVCVVPEEIYYCWNDLECPPGTNKCVFHGVCPPGEVDCMGICEP